ncbi:hypothetical protein G6F37_006256 [Rhizopus arrhizus]|nr:hypothetical protein G6F38_006809 [Rhizopus arrhizus]KAG1157941.1 hypothetical protein G6F37_006256 [Rhizopus arrhizus]
MSNYNIKLEPEDDFMADYLNVDYLSTEAPLSPPNSTTSSSSAGGYSPEKQVANDFLLDMSNSGDLLINDWTSTMDPCLLEQQQPDLLNTFPFFLSTPSLPSNSLSSEPPKKKRGRKKREVVPVMQPAQPSLLAPKPLAPRPTSATTTTTTTSSSSPAEAIIKLEAQQLQEQEQPKPEQGYQEQQQENVLLTSEQEAQKMAQLAKRQERLIKNRAAALLSRKRKREHLNSLEEENEKLHGQVDELEKKVKELEKENTELKQRLNIKSNTNTKTSKATGVVFMILFFSFALFTLPSRISVDNRLTVGGSSMTIQQQYPLIEDGSGYAMTPLCNENCKEQNTDLVLIDSVRPRDLQTWIHRKLEKDSSKGQSHLYLYSKEFSQMASLTKTSKHKGNKPMLSLISPYNQTADICDRYLQIDVQVLGSKVIEGQLMSLQQYDYPSALLDGMKKDLITYPRKNYKKEKKSISPPIVNHKSSRVIS